MDVFQLSWPVDWRQSIEAPAFHNEPLARTNAVFRTAHFTLYLLVCRKLNLHFMLSVTWEKLLNWLVFVRCTQEYLAYTTGDGIMVGGNRPVSGETHDHWQVVAYLLTYGRGRGQHELGLN